MGTAIGELPPYFMARAARLSGAFLGFFEYYLLETLVGELRFEIVSIAEKEYGEGLLMLIEMHIYVQVNTSYAHTCTYNS